MAVARATENRHSPRGTRGTHPVADMALLQSSQHLGRLLPSRSARSPAFRALAPCTGFLAARRGGVIASRLSFFVLLCRACRRNIS